MCIDKNTLNTQMIIIKKIKTTHFILNQKQTIKKKLQKL